MQTALNLSFSSILDKKRLCFRTSQYYWWKCYSLLYWDCSRCT